MDPEHPQRSGDPTLSTHASPVSKKWFADPEVVRRDLMNLSTVVDIDEVLGGEPLRSCVPSRPIPALRLSLRVSPTPETDPFPTGWGSVSSDVDNSQIHTG